MSAVETKGELVIKTETMPEETPSYPDASWLLSGMYCMVVVILSVVICSTHYITPDITETTVDVYYVFLCLIGSVWLVAFKPLAKSCSGESCQFQKIKSTHSTNRWLKGVLAVFGIAIIIKDVLEFLTIFEYTESECRKPVYFAAPIAQIIFIVTEVNFLFRYSKFHLQERQRLNRFGAMHVMATNLSIWMLIIIDETMSSYGYHGSEQDSSSSSPSPLVVTSTYAAGLSNWNTSEIEKLPLAGAGDGDSHYVYYPGNVPARDSCYCNTSFCGAVGGAHTFLYPFLVEFSLVSSCMIYIVWKNIGSYPRHAEAPVKPAYKFYKAYKGLVAGAVTLVATVVVLIFLNNVNSAIPEAERSYESEEITLIICNTFIVVVEIAMLCVCIFGLVLFNAEPRPMTASFDLDVVLLLLTIVGSAILDVYYPFAVYVSLISNRYSYKWIWGTIYPIVDLTQCIVQVAFLLAGLSRHPVLEKDVLIEMETVTSTGGNSDSGIHVGYANEDFIREESLVIEVPPEDSSGDIQGTDLSGGRKTSFSNDGDKEIDKPDIVQLPNYEKLSSSEFSNWKHSTNYQKTELKKVTKNGEGTENEDPNIGDSIPRHIDRLKIAAPNRTRLRTREALMFLLVANASLWMFWSLEGTAFKLFTYPYQYYSMDTNSTRNTWHAATMFCLPLSIFFRMHSCACLFEVWSLT